MGREKRREMNLNLTFAQPRHQVLLLFPICRREESSNRDSRSLFQMLLLLETSCTFIVSQSSLTKSGENNCSPGL